MHAIGLLVSKHVICHLIRLQNKLYLFVISKRIWTLDGTRLQTTTPKWKLKTVRAVFPSKDSRYTIWLCTLGCTQKATLYSHICNSISPALSSVNELSYNVTKHSCVIFCWPVIPHDYCHIHCSASICLHVGKDIRCPFSSELFVHMKPI